MNNSSIDLSKLPAPDFVQALSYESILADMLADFTHRAPDHTSALESDPAYKILEVAAYRELLLRHRINEDGRALLIAFATGADLDHLGVTYYNGEQRLQIRAADANVSPPLSQLMENDESYRRRLLLKDDSYSTAGSNKAYQFHALSSAGQVKDASVTSPHPGTTVISILSHEGNGLASLALLEQVRQRLNQDDVRPLSEEVIVQSAEIVEWALDADIYTYAGPDQNIVLRAAEDSFAAYLREQQLLQADITDSALSRALHVPGVFKVVRRSPVNDIVCSPTQAAWCTAVQLQIAGSKP
ncbi:MULTISPECIES: baseplate assembly protein [unclassified Undibacterium]|uniref:baseplate assembly protein n=1 Tax=unclassified Undibacterium TaxID=2630295 RepID=UPI002AC8B449|nr:MULTISPECIES: baseplate J/gp47 family protein [unclassified Undibacterium]MEB0137991.1 baseplate J/gp47 family protein [Undibacterium sp. CCC2.1]MEB0170676.1 baseplate J/gp47 family protein [Undibacterium sp. CCC1.1]MEB0177017.1 baseplate J/gp47 family protein [Undibacterium sp. CCC3.4]MEB0216306.1 baseplate J/gp47 family protein [Undibacterium sp. 5I2]WPX42490.1 baseplate J/gp47 family protein [Undibacterium sp. CCC3.4]